MTWVMPLRTANWNCHTQSKWFILIQTSLFLILPIPAFVFGDPHFITFDQRRYTFNGIGEYQIMEISSLGFRLQGRTTMATEQGNDPGKKYRGFIRLFCNVKTNKKINKTWVLRQKSLGFFWGLRLAMKRTGNKGQLYFCIFIGGICN